MRAPDWKRWAVKQESSTVNKCAVNPNWFTYLHATGLEEHFKWLKQLSALVETIANFGCCSNEPFALLWTLDAMEIKVIEKNPKNLQEWPIPTRKELEEIKHLQGRPLQGRSVEFIVADMSMAVADLLPNHFDLAYCEEVLYNMDSDLQMVQNAVNEMARVVIKPGGWVIAIESQIGAKSVEDGPLRYGNPIDISSLFETAGLIRTDLDGAPEWSYCYRKFSS